MKINKSQYMTLALVLAFIIISTSSSYAQIPIFDDDVNDEPVASISGLIALGLAVGGYLGIRQTRKQD
ncbi:hypothetical protein ES731_07635 [Psychroflexus gondwanensis]|jgi:uncharacterized membrane protein YfcA|uniref:hypothetical protein n=1 Tax=Psychroflexus gondwanensis TaxID=251 RepID=UPI0011BF0D08|nr:hypothetical protein [Psychroflexus gondwanensis]TXE19468.1 hypothetical protein ES731_07635 [Psychroflexus gondwanensis]